MKTKMKIMLTLLALGCRTAIVSAQENQPCPWRVDEPRGPGMNGHRPPAPAIVAALDVNHDGVIDADEIANATAELKSLDKNGDGKLTPDELGRTSPMDGGPTPIQRRSNEAPPVTSTGGTPNQRPAPGGNKILFV